MSTQIPYLDEVWSCFVGCSPVNAGCERCWAKRLEDGRCRHLGRCATPDERRLTSAFVESHKVRGRWREEHHLASRHELAIGINKTNPYFNRGPIRQPLAEWAKPLHWKKPRVVGVCFNSDWMHKDIAEPREMLDVMDNCWRHTFVTTTKRPRRLLEVCAGDVAKNVWLGVSVHDQQTAQKACEVLLDLARQDWHTWLSIEPMLAPIALLPLLCATAVWRPKGVILGGESGAGARPMQADWVRRVRDDCKAAGVKFYFKQWGRTPGLVRRYDNGTDLPLLDGWTHDDLPWAQAGKEAT